MRFNKQFFERRQGLLLKAANNKLFSWLLGINRLPKPLKGKKIYKILPNAIVTIDGDNFVYHFFVRPRFSEALAFNISPIPVIQVRGKMAYRFSPAGLAFGALFGYFGGLGIVGATDTYTEAGDGVVYISNSVWNTAHDALTGDGVDYTSDDALDCWTGKESDGRYRIGRGFTPFDTSGLSEAPTTATYNIYKKDGNLNDDDAQAYVRVVDQAEGAKDGQAATATLATADFDQCGATDNPTALATDKDLDTISTGSYTVFTLNATGLGIINISGNTLIGIREGHDVEDVAYAGSNSTLNSVRFYTSQRTGTSEDPYLSTSTTVDYDIVAAVGAFTLTGIAATLLSARSILASVGAFTLTGFAAALKRGYGILAALGTFALTSIDTALTSSRSIAAAVGSFTLTGIAATLLRAVNFVASVGSFILTGFSARLGSGAWKDRTKPSSSYTERSKPTTNWIDE